MAYIVTACNASADVHCDQCGELIRACIYLDPEGESKVCRQCVPKQNVQAFFEEAVRIASQESKP